MGHKKSTSLENGRDSPRLNRKKLKGFVAFSYSSVSEIKSPSVTVDQAKDKCLLLFIPVLALLFGKKKNKNKEYQKTSKNDVTAL